MPKTDTKLDHRPYIENYPPLREWLDRLDARCLQQERFGNDMVETWFAPSGNAPFVILVRANGNGWEIFTSAATNRVDATFADAEARLGIKPECEHGYPAGRCIFRQCAHAPNCGVIEAVPGSRDD